MGEMQDQSDVQLLREFARNGADAAFREVVARYADLVYSAALRQLESSAAAGDIAQGVFTDLARKARQVAEQMPEGNSLAGWLHRATRYAALNHLRDARRRLTHERQAMEQLLTNSESSANWEQIRPALDEALDSLGDEDREALLLRYFKNQDFRAVGLALGVSDDAAQKRVTRAVERLREYFSKRNVTIGASGLAVLISANAVQSAPAGLAAAISAAALLTGTAVTTFTTAIAVAKTIVMTTLQKALLTVAVAALAGGGIYETHQAAQLRQQNQTLQQQQAPLVEQNQVLRRERDEATNQLFALADQTTKTGSDNNELLRLRGEVGVLRQQLTAQRAAIVKQPKAGTSADSASPDVTGQLVAAIEQGDSTALGKLSEYAKERSDSYRANSLGLMGDEQAAAWSKSFGGITSAFDSLADAAIKGNANARQAIDQAIRIKSLQGWDVTALGKLAGAGDENALEILLNPREYGMPLSSTVSALGPAADSGNPKAIAALAAILGDETKKALWLLASQALQEAAGSGNAVAIAALKSISPPQ